MNYVFIRTESHYTVDRKRVRKLVERVFAQKGVKGDTEVSIAVVGDRMMRRLNKKYRNLTGTTNVLSFPLSDEKAGKPIPFIGSPDDRLRLGDIVISYPQVQEEAANENKLIDDKVDELVEHGLLHLLGYHHE